MKNHVAASVLIGLCCAASAPRLSAQTCPLVEEQVRAMAKIARAANPIKTEDFLKALDKSVKGSMRKLTTDQIVVVYSDEIMVLVIAPYSGYRSSLEESIRIMEPIDNAKWTNGFRVIVIPQRITAPDITRVVVQRDGTTVEPTRVPPRSPATKDCYGSRTSASPWDRHVSVLSLRAWRDRYDHGDSRIGQQHHEDTQAGPTRIDSVNSERPAASRLERRAERDGETLIRCSSPCFSAIRVSARARSDARRLGSMGIRSLEGCLMGSGHSASGPSD